MKMNLNRKLESIKNSNGHSRTEKQTNKQKAKI